MLSVAGLKAISTRFTVGRYSQGGEYSRFTVGELFPHCGPWAASVSVNVIKLIMLA